MPPQQFQSLGRASALDGEQRRVAPQPLERVERARLFDEHVDDHVAVVEEEPAALRGALAVPHADRPPRAARRAPPPRWCPSARWTARADQEEVGDATRAPAGRARRGRRPSCRAPRAAARRTTASGRGAPSRWPSRYRPCSRDVGDRPPRACGRRGSARPAPARRRSDPEMGSEAALHDQHRAPAPVRLGADERPEAELGRTFWAAGAVGSKALPLRGTTTRRARPGEPPRLVPRQEVQKGLRADDEVQLAPRRAAPRGCPPCRRARARRSSTSETSKRGCSATASRVIATRCAAGASSAAGLCGGHRRGHEEHAIERERLARYRRRRADGRSGSGLKEPPNTPMRAASGLLADLPVADARRTSWW